MTLKIEGPGALAGAAGAKVENIETPEMYEIPTQVASLNRLRSAHVASLCGLTDHRAAMIAAVYFAEGAQ